MHDRIKTVEWTDAGVLLIDQRQLPHKEEYLLCRTVGEVAAAIRSMAVRGAPAIGVTAALGLALGLQNSRAKTLDELRAEFVSACELLAATRPTAVNLFWAIGRMRERFERLCRNGAELAAIRQQMLREAQSILQEDVAACRAIGDFGAELLPSGTSVMTACNAGALATAGYGTALGVIRSAVRAGKQIDVLALETRPFLQGARLTAWELQQDGIPVTLITDNMAGHFLHSGRVGAVVVGADRIAANGDTANKIGTYGLAVLAQENQVPFFVAAPLSTIDLELASGDLIPIEHRSADEVTHLLDIPIAPEGVAACHPAFDITPHRYITAIVTERGIARPPYGESLRAQKKGSSDPQAR
ncbi:MAG TPA: S-methyl-5-thioribose-1-phosphate isomerase [Terriglobia bacterium]|nr:S-methyl-5-thioribose-1-phosphate isomerase [Terriglobia bacterium]